MGVHSGRWGVVNGIDTVKQWSINDAHNAAQAVASNTGFGTLRREGVHDWTGSFLKLGAGEPPAFPGDTIAFLGYEAPNDDASGVGVLYSGNALITQMALMLNWAQGEIISQQFDFGGHLALACNSAGSQQTDSAAPDAPSVGGTKLTYSTDGSTWYEWTDLVSATWNLINAVQTYVNSSTYVSNALWTGRKKGHWDWNLAVTEQNGDRTRFQKGDHLWIRIYIDATDYWQLKVGQVKDFTGININRETGAIIQQTVNVEMNSNLLSDGSIGHILKPDGTAFWGDV